LDDLPREKVVGYVKGLRDYLKNSKPQYIEIVQGQKQLTDEAETLLKEAITEFKKTFLAA
jgi:F-type H+-transporting ATPase subunit alpha